MTPLNAEAPPPVNVAKPNPRNNVTMFKIFQNVQYNVVQHKKYVKEMIKLYKKLDQDVFRESFKNALQYLFTFGDTSANVDRVVQFVALFCTSLGDDEEFLQFIFEIIFECQCVSGQSVRYRASQLLAAVLVALGEDAFLDDIICDKLLNSQLNRLQDTRGAVRCRAALALQRLQNPPDDEVSRAFQFHMSCDPSSSVRRAVLMVVAKVRQSVPWVLKRLCDIDEGVRRAAFLFMAAMPVLPLSVKQRLTTLKVGLTERSARVRRVVEEILIPGWLSAFRGNIVALLKAIRLDNSEDAKDSQYVAGKLLESLFKRLPISELLESLPIDKTLRVIPAEQLNKDSAWYWRHLAQHLQAIDDDETLETVLPDLVVLTGYIRVILESPCPPEADLAGFSTRQYVLHELACMLRVYDASDPAGRTALQALINDALTGDYGPLQPEVLCAFVSALDLVVPDVSQRMEIVAQVINYLRDSAEPEMPPPPPPPPPTVDDTKAKLERARLRVSLNVAIEAQEEAVRDQNYALAAECKAKVENIQRELEILQTQPAPPPPPPPPEPVIKERVSNAEILNKCLTILNAALDTSQLKSITPMLQTIFNDLEVEIFKNEEILENALETVALYGILSKEFANECKPFFFAKAEDMELNYPVRIKALQCIVDLLCVHGARVFEDKPTNSMLENSGKAKSLQCVEAVDSTIPECTLSLSPDHSYPIDILLEVISEECPLRRPTAVEGLCRLLHLGHLESPSIICKLILLWFNPANVAEDIVRQTIGVFFQTFPISVDSAQEQIQKATILVFRALVNAPVSSPIADIDQEAVVRFIVSLTRVNHDLTDSQGAMALLLCHYVSRQPAALESVMMCRMLALLAPPRECRLATQLAALLRDACQQLPDRQARRNLTRYLGALEATERASLKMSSSGMPEGTLQSEDTMLTIGRATSSLPQPLARSTHVVINETVEEEVEIDETSPTNTISKISEIHPVQPPETSRKSSGNASDAVSAPVQADGGSRSSDSDGISPVKKAKVIKGKKKKLQVTKERSGSKKSEPQEKQTKAKHKGAAAENGGVKRSRSQRSLVDVERAQKAKAKTQTKISPPKSPSPPPLRDLDLSNVTIRKSARRVHSGSSLDSNGSVESGGKKGGKAAKKQGKTAKAVTRSSGSTRSSAGSGHGSVFEDSAEETQLHTIVYDNDFEQSLLNDSELQDSKQACKANVTIPETPDGSNESESEPEPEPVPAKGKGKRNGKK